MAPSPELGQPKAPDKGESSSASTTAASADTRGGASHDGGATKGADTSKTPAQDSENFEHFDDGQLKALLDEAITYKTPKDREHKSEAFKILLERAEIQEQAQELNYEFRASRASGGSLQDLANPDVDFFGSSMTHQRKHHNSRQKKYSTTSSVSSRQREGGSLPSNVNVSTNHLFQYDATQPFLNEVKNKRSGCRKVDLQPIVMYSSAGSDLVDKRDRKLHADGEGGVLLVSREGKLRDTDDGQHLEHDSLAQNHGDRLGGDDSYEKNALSKIPRASFTSQKNIDLGHHSTQVDKGVEFSALADSCAIKNVDMTPVQLNASYKAVNSVVNPSGEPSKNVSASLTHRISVKQTSNREVSTSSLLLLDTVFNKTILQQKTDENGNSVNTFSTSATVTVPQPSKTKKKISKSERNTITKASHEIDGFRGRDNIETLVRFIENKENTRKKDALKAKESKNSSNNGNNVIVPGDRGAKKDKKGAGKKDHKLKKSNSMDELSSCSKLEDIARSEINHEIGGVTLRTKNTGKKSASETTPLLGGSAQKNGKRGERRSWGTEELSYLGEAETAAQISEAQQPKSKKSKESSQNSTTASSTLPLGGSNLKQKKDDQQSLSIESMSATYELAEFHVVTKKKKAKKRQNIIVTPFEGDGRAMSGQKTLHGTPGGSRSGPEHVNAGQNRAKVVYNHQTSSQFTNDRDVYVNDRRKSTSSVPPSEKSDSSDLDSVHSLPVESSTALSLGLTTIPSATSSTPPQASYADIARIANNNSGEPRFQLKDNWPAMPLRHSNQSNNQETMETASTNSGSTSVSGKSQNSVVHRSVVPSASSPPASVAMTSAEVAAIDDNPPCPESAKKSTVATINGVIAPNVEKLTNTPAAGVQNMADVIKSTMIDQKNQLQKSKSVENEATAYFGSIDHYPALEKTVKSKVSHHQQQQQLYHQQQQTATALGGGKNVPNVDMMTKKSKTIVSSNSSVSCNNSNNISSSSSNCNVIISQNLAVKMSLVEQLKSPSLVNSVNSRSDMPRNGNNNNNNGVSAQQQSVPTTTATIPDETTTTLPAVSTKTTHRAKKSERIGQYDVRNNCNHSSSRPAVIILNDNDRYRQNDGDGITFGFDINSQLLFGDFNENELHLLESTPPPPSTVVTNSCASSVVSGQTTDTGYGSNSSTGTSSEVHDNTADSIINNSVSSQKSSELTSSDGHFNHSMDSAEEPGNPHDQHLHDDEEMEPTPILKACVSVQTSMEHLYINDMQQPPPLATVCVEERDSSIITSIPAQVTFTRVEADNNNIIQMLSPTAAPQTSKRYTGKKLNVRYVAPAGEELILTTYNHDKIVHFVGMAWENVAGNDGVKYYDGQ
ncbi:hypothetical protein DMENIID0001_122710 [Sergentomyia squamirostris]